MVLFVDHLQLIFDTGYFTRAEVVAIVEAMAQTVLLLDCRGEDTFTRRVPSCTTSIYNHCSDFTRTYDCFAKIIIRHIP